MKPIFLESATHNATESVCLDELPAVIRKRTGWDYSFTQTDSGCFLKPTFRSMPYHNSFVPEIDVVVSHNDTQTVLHFRGQPVKAVRIFMGFWFGFLLLMELPFFILAFTSHMDSNFPVFIPLLMMVFGYLLCKLATRATFRSIVKAIQDISR